MTGFMPWNDFHSVILNIGPKRPVMHRLGSTPSKTKCGAYRPEWSSYLRTDHAALFCQPCGHCARKP